MNKSTDEPARPDRWDPGLYAGKHSFVWELSNSLVDTLAPQAGERIIDLGCGTGQLTAAIAESGAIVCGIDSSEAMLKEARSAYPNIEFNEGDARTFQVQQPYDAVFSNAAFHWIRESDLVARRIAHALRPGGRLVVEFGGKGNVRRLTAAIEEASKGITGTAIPHPWYFPGIADYAGVLERHGLEVTQAALIDRPTELEGEDGLRDWVRMFGGHWLASIDPSDHEAFFQAIEKAGSQHLRKPSGWIADYRRIRVIAHKP